MIRKILKTILVVGCFLWLPVFLYFCVFGAMVLAGLQTAMGGDVSTGLYGYCLTYCFMKLIGEYGVFFALSTVFGALFWKFI